jgi:hypothetical protein
MKSLIFRQIMSLGCLSLTVIALNSCSVGPTKSEKEATEARMISEKVQKEARITAKEEKLRGSRPSRDQFIAAIQKHLAYTAIDPSTPIRTRNFRTIFPYKSFWILPFEANGKNKMGGWTGWQSKKGVWALDGKYVSTL